MKAILKNGTAIELRAITPDDAGRLTDSLARLSDTSRRLRFFSARRSLSKDEVTWLTNVDHHDREAIVAVHEDEIIGVVRYDRLLDRHDAAEIAIVVADDWQRLGVATELIDRLIAHASLHGVTNFVADTLYDNRAVRSMLASIGTTIARETWIDGAVQIEMQLEAPEPP